MHILVLLASALTAAIFLWVRLRNVAHVAEEVVDGVARARGSVKRRRFRAKANLSPFTAIDDPVVGAATIIVAIADETGALDDDLIATLERDLARVSTPQNAQEAVVYAQWAVRQAAEASTVMRHASPLLNQTLTEPQRRHLVAMTHALCADRVNNQAGLDTLLGTLRQRLAIAN